MFCAPDAGVAVASVARKQSTRMSGTISTPMHESFIEALLSSSIMSYPLFVSRLAPDWVAAVLVCKWEGSTGRHSNNGVI